MYVIFIFCRNICNIIRKQVKLSFMYGKKPLTNVFNATLVTRHRASTGTRWHFVFGAMFS